MGKQNTSSFQGKSADTADDALPPNTRRVLKIAKKAPPLPVDWNYRDELVDAIIQHYESSQSD